MSYLPELTAALVLLGGLLLYYVYNRPVHREEKKELLTKYRKVRTKSLKLQEKLSTYILINDAISERFLPGMTYGEFLKELQKNHGHCLSEKIYLKIRNGRNKSLIRKMNKVLDQQEEKLKETEQKLSLL